MDPGELFPWNVLAQNGVGLYPANAQLAALMTQASTSTFASMLASYGYGVSPDIEIPLPTVVTAFQRHFRPERVDGIIDGDCEARLRALLQLINPQ